MSISVLAFGSISSLLLFAVFGVAVWHIDTKGTNKKQLAYISANARSLAMNAGSPTVRRLKFSVFNLNNREVIVFFKVFFL